MHTIILKEYGSILTGREKGKSTMLRLDEKTPPNEEIIFDLTGVLSMGSSFGDEIFPKIANRQAGRITVRGASPSVRHCLELVASDANITIQFE
jgi:anti-anti-sigma regulatory factor